MKGKRYFEFIVDFCYPAPFCNYYFYGRTAWIAGIVSSIIIVYSTNFSHIKIQNIKAIRKKFVLAMIFVFIIIIGILCYINYTA